MIIFLNGVGLISNVVWHWAMCRYIIIPIKSNCEYEMDFDNELISIKTVRFIKEGEELFINYNGDWNDGKTVWFETK